MLMRQVSIYQFLGTPQKEEWEHQSYQQSSLKDFFNVVKRDDYLQELPTRIRNQEIPEIPVSKRRGPGRPPNKEKNKSRTLLSR